MYVGHPPGFITGFPSICHSSFQSLGLAVNCTSRRREGSLVLRESHTLTSHALHYSYCTDYTTLHYTTLHYITLHCLNCLMLCSQHASVLEARRVEYACVLDFES